MNNPLRERLQVLAADITKLKVDAIVNAANETLLGGGGVDGAIHRAAGPALLEECRTLNGCPAGEARLTAGYKLPARYVIHTVGPVWQGGGSGEAELLAACYRNCFQLAREHRLRTLAFPAISCGVYGYPVRHAARIAIAETISGLQQNPEIDDVIFACFGEEVFWAYERALNASL